MRGVSNEWTNIEYRNFVPFNALSPGEYIFELKGSNDDNIWNETGISLNIVVTPPFWKSIYAYFLYVVIVIVTLFIRVRERKLLHDKYELEKEVVKRTLQVKEQNDLIKTKNAELEELNLSKDKFFSIIGHDLGNQFNTILSYSESLVTEYEKWDIPRIKQAVAGIYNTSVQAHELLENLLTWARLQRGAIQYHPQEFLINNLIEETSSLQQEAILKKDIDLIINSDEQTIVYADIDMLATVFRNIVSNAIKFSHQGGSITITTKNEYGICIISVKDNGVGISEKNIKKIFRIDSNYSTKGTMGELGTGLGLILCKEFIEIHKGKIWVDSQPEKGSTFSFSIPLSKQKST